MFISLATLKTNDESETEFNDSESSDTELNEEEEDKLNDEATQLFMTDFYRDYLKNNSKHHVLKTAQEYLKNYISDEGEHVCSNSYYWAGFILLDALN